MKIVESADGGLVREIVTAMIVNKEVLSMVASIWEPNMFGPKWANIIGRWCVDYFIKYDRPPKKQIESLFDTWANEKERDKETTDLTEKFLTGLSDQYRKAKKGINAQYTIDLAGVYFNQAKMERVHEKIGDELKAGNTEDALALFQSLKKVEIGAGAGYSLLDDKERLRLAFERKSTPLIEYPGALGHFLGDVFERDGLVSFEGPEKRGKSWWLFDVVWRGFMERRNVAIFSAGDMSEDQVNRRFAIRASRRPLGAGKTVRKPIAIERGDEDRLAQVTFKERTYKKRMEWTDAWNSFQEWKKAIGTPDPIRVSCHPSQTISAKGIHNIVETWTDKKWVPDIIVIDYADILAPIDGKVQKIEQIDSTWSYLRRLSQELHCCVVTATQTNKESYTAETIGMKHFSNNKAKRAYVTASIGINQKDDEKESGVYRLNFVARREDEYSESKVVYVAGCLAIGNPAILSVL